MIRDEFTDSARFFLQLPESKRSYALRFSRLLVELAEDKPTLSRVDRDQLRRRAYLALTAHQRGSIDAFVAILRR